MSKVLLDIFLYRIDISVSASHYLSMSQLPQHSKFLLTVSFPCPNISDIGGSPIRDSDNETNTVNLKLQNHKPASRKKSARNPPPPTQHAQSPASIPRLSPAPIPAMRRSGVLIKSPWTQRYIIIESNLSVIKNQFRQLWGLDGGFS